MLQRCLQSGAQIGRYGIASHLEHDLDTRAFVVGNMNGKLSSRQRFG